MQDSDAIREHDRHLRRCQMLPEIVDALRAIIPAAEWTLDETSPPGVYERVVQAAKEALAKYGAI